MTEQHHLCAGCGAAGRLPVIVWHRSAEHEDPRPTVRPVFGFYQDQPGRPALLCERCRVVWQRRSRTLVKGA